jgi:methylamine---glutamate N-methyltransferase subunit B
MPASMTATIDGHGKTTRAINAELKTALAAGESDIEVLNPGSRHSLAVGILVGDAPGALSASPARIVFRGDVGYFCGALSDGLDIEVHGDAGWSVGADMMSGKIVVHGNSGSSTAPSIRGGIVVVQGNAGARSGIAVKGGTVLIGGSTGYMTGFMMQKGRLVVCGDAGEAFGDSMYQGELFCGGDVKDLGSDTVLEEPTDEELAWLADTTTPFGLSPLKEWKKVRSAGKLWRYDKKEFAVWKEAL